MKNDTLMASMSDFLKPPLPGSAIRLDAQLQTEPSLEVRLDHGSTSPSNQCLHESFSYSSTKDLGQLCISFPLFFYDAQVHYLPEYDNQTIISVSPLWSPVDLSRRLESAESSYFVIPFSLFMLML